MKERINRQSISSLAAFLLLGVFAGCLLFALLGGAGVYSRLTRRDQAAYDSRTCAQYLATKVRQASSPVHLTTFGDSDALTMEETIDGTVYLTRIYCHDGWLMELFSAADGTFAPQDGEKLLPAEALSLTRESNLLSVEITQNQTITRLNLFLRMGEEASA